MLVDDIKRVDNSINYTPLNSNVRQAWDRIKKELAENSIPLDVVEKLVLKWVGKEAKKEVSALLREYVNKTEFRGNMKNK